MEWEIKDPGRAYSHWAVQMAENTKAGVPWIMCKQDYDVPDNVVSEPFTFIPSSNHSNNAQHKINIKSFHHVTWRWVDYLIMFVFYLDFLVIMEGFNLSKNGFCKIFYGSLKISLFVCKTKTPYIRILPNLVKQDLHCLEAQCHYT